MKYLAVLFVGTMVYWEAASFGGRPPNYSQDQMPITSFSCRDKILGGYYADPETQCQMFHVCVKVPGLGVQDYKFLCPNDTSFDQENQICDDWYNIDCEASTLFYSDNFDLYRIGSDLGGELVRDTPRLPNNNINNAVSDIDDDNYLQRGDRGENVGSDILRGSHSGNFFSNKHRGREDEDIKDELNKKKKAAGNKNQVRKLLTGKRPVAPSQVVVAYQDNTQGTTAAAQQTRVNFASRNRVASNFQKNQQVTEVPQRQTEVYNNQRQNYNNNNQRNFYTPTTPKIETTPTQRSDYYKHNYYNPVTQQNSKFYDSTQNYNSQTNKNFATQPTTKFPPNFPTTKNYQSYTPSSTQSPVTYNSQPAAPERINNYETQKLFKLNTAAFNQDQYDESKDDEFLKTAHSQNLGASNFNRVQNTLKQWNTSLTANYNFNQPTTTKSSLPFQQNYNPTTLRPSNQYFQYNGQQGNIYTQSTTQKPYQQSQSNFFTPSTTQKPQQQNNYVTASTSLKTFSQNVNTFFSPSTTQKPYQQTQNNFYTPSTTQKTTQQLNNVNTANPLNKGQNNFYSATTPPNIYQQRNFLTQTSSPNSFQQNNVRAQNPTPKPYQETHRQHNNYYTQKPDQPTTTKPRPRGGALYSHTTDATENPRPFTVPSTKITDSKDKEQYDYAYYDDGAQAPEYEVDTVDFARTKSKNKS